MFEMLCSDWLLSQLKMLFHDWPLVVWFNLDVGDRWRHWLTDINGYELPVSVNLYLMFFHRCRFLKLPWVTNKGKGVLLGLQLASNRATVSRCLELELELDVDASKPSIHPNTWTLNSLPFSGCCCEGEDRDFSWSCWQLYIVGLLAHQIHSLTALKYLN